MDTNLTATTRGGIDAFWLKIIAITGMTLDHIGIILGGDFPVAVNCFLYAFGGLTFPIMAYFLGEGYRHTRNVRNYMLRLLIFAFVAQIPYGWAMARQYNVLFTILLGLLAIHAVETINSRVRAWAIVVLLVLVSFFCDWGLMGVPMVLCYYYIQGRWSRLVVPILIPVCFRGGSLLLELMSGYSLLDLLPQLLYIFVGCVLTIPLLAHYSGERGRPMKYFFYAYYPVHLAILGVLNGLIFSDWGNFVLDQIFPMVS